MRKNLLQYRYFIGDFAYDHQSGNDGSGVDKVQPLA